MLLARGWRLSGKVGCRGGLLLIPPPPSKTQLGQGSLRWGEHSKGREGGITSAEPVVHPPPLSPRGREGGQAPGGRPGGMGHLL